MSYAQRPSPAPRTHTHTHLLQVRATHGAHQGTWYYEVRVERLGEGGAARLGWSTSKGELQAPVGTGERAGRGGGARQGALGRERDAHVQEGGGGLCGEMHTYTHTLLPHLAPHPRTPHPPLHHARTH